MIVDVHAHVMPAGYISLPGPIGGSFAERFRGNVDRTTLEERFAMMDEAGVARQVLSPTCAPYAEDRARARTAARLINDHYAALQHDHPARLQMWGSLPLPAEAFGPEQLVTGSDYPILLPFESYRQTFDHIRDSGLEPSAIATILENAGRLLDRA